MSLRSGLAGSVGFKLESSYGVPVVVDSFLPLVSETLTWDQPRVESDAIMAGREIIDSDQWFGGGITVAGNLQFELYNAGLTALLTAALGGANAGTYTPADLYGDSLTVQLGKPGVDGTVRAVEYAGCKVGSWEIAATEGAICTMGVSLIGRAEYRYRVVTDGVLNSTTTVTSATAQFSKADIGAPISATGIPAATTIASVESATSITLSAAATATASSVSITIGRALASVSYTADTKPFMFHQASVTIAGTSVPVKSLTISGDNALDERRFLGTPLTSEPITAGLRSISGDVVAEFTDLTLYNYFVRGVEAALVATFNNGSQSITITTNARFDGATPHIAGRGILEQPLNFKCIGDGTDADAFTLVVA
jgi:hypothetical protein